MTEAVLTLVGVLAPLPFGSTDPLIVAVWVAVLACGLMAAAFARIGFAQGRVVVATLVILLLVCGVGMLQSFEGNSLVPPDPLWTKASAALGVILTPAIGLMKHKPFYSLAPTFAFTLAFMLGVIVGGCGVAKGSRLLNAIAWSGVCYAAYGLFALAVTPNLVLWEERPGYSGYLLATFLQRNTAATYFGTISLLWLMRVLHGLQTRVRPPLTWKRLFKTLEQHVDRDLIQDLFGLGISFLALMLTASRAGVVLSFAVFLLAGILYLWPFVPRAVSPTRTVVATLVISLVVLQLTAGTVIQRFQGKEADDNVATRFALQKTAMRIVAGHPWLGTGLGTFPTVFSSYRERPPSIDGIYPYAYSTPIELTSEIGVPTMIVIAGTAVVVLLRLGKTMLASRGRRAALVAAFFTAILAIAHSTFDYPLQVPGFAIVAAAITGVGVGIGLLPAGSWQLQHASCEAKRREMSVPKSSSVPDTDTTSEPS